MICQEEATTIEPEVSLQQSIRRHDATVIARGAMVNFLGTLAKVVKSTTFILLPRLFGTEVFGLYILAWSIIDLVSKVGSFALDRGLLKFVVQYRSDGNEQAVYRILGQSFVIGCTLSAVIAAVLYLTAPLIAHNVFNKPELTTMLHALALAIPFLTVTQIVLGATKSLRIMKFDAYIKSITEPMLLFVAACVFFIIGWRFSGIAYAHVFAVIGGAICAVFIFRRFFSWRQCFNGMRDTRLWSELTRFSLPVMGYELLYILMMRLDALMVGYFLPAMQVGIYVVAIEIALTTKKVRQWFDPIFAPIISELAHQNDTERLAHNFAMVTRWILTINIAFFFSMILIGEDLLALFGSAFTVGIMCLIVLSLSQVLYSSMGSGDILLIMAGHPYLNLFNTGVVVILNFVLNLILIPRYGMLGAAMGTLIAFGVLSIIRVIEVYRVQGIHPFRLALLKPFIASLSAFALGSLVAIWLPEHGLWRAILLALTFLTVYGTLLVCFGLEEEERMIIQRICARFRRSKTGPGQGFRLSA